MSFVMTVGCCDINVVRHSRRNTGRGRAQGNEEERKQGREKAWEEDGRERGRMDGRKGGEDYMEGEEMEGRKGILLTKVAADDVITCLVVPNTKAQIRILCLSILCTVFAVLHNEQLGQTIKIKKLR